MKATDQISSLYYNARFTGFFVIIIVGLIIGSYFAPDPSVTVYSIVNDTTEEEILEILRILKNITLEKKFTLDSSCDDGNQCTTDGRNTDGQCMSVIMTNGYPCISPCGISGRCQVGQCVPDICSGNCEEVMDCPDFVANDGSNDTSIVVKSCIAGICVYQTNITSAMDDIDRVAPGDNSLARQMCFKSIMATSVNQTIVNVNLDLDQDGIPNVLDDFTVFDPLDTIQSTPPGLFGTSTITLTTPNWLNGTERTISYSDMNGILPGQIISIDLNAVLFFTSFAVNYAADVTWNVTEDFSLEQLSHLNGLVGECTALLCQYTVSVIDSNGQEVSISFIPFVFDFTPWSLDLRSNPNLDPSSIATIRISMVELVDFGNTDSRMKEFHFTFTPESVIPVSECMEHIPERQSNGDILCTHYFTCSCPEPSINPISMS